MDNCWFCITPTFSSEQLRNRIHHKTFGGRAPPEPGANSAPTDIQQYLGRAASGRSKGSGKGREGKGHLRFRKEVAATVVAYCVDGEIQDLCFRGTLVAEVP